MSAARWETIQQLFAAALEQPPEQRETYLTEAVRDAALRDEVLSLLRAHEARGRLDSIMERLASVHPADSAKRTSELLRASQDALGQP